MTEETPSSATVLNNKIGYQANRAMFMRDNARPFVTDPTSNTKKARTLASVLSTFLYVIAASIIKRERGLCTQV